MNTMGKKSILFIGLLLSLYEMKAQAPATNMYSVSQIVFEGYLIRVLPVNNNGFSYNVYFKGKMIMQQKINPFNLSPLGFRSKEEAFMTAKWQLQQLHHQNTVTLIKDQRFSKEVGRKLSVSVN
jgi:hypothetical protein